LLDAGDSAAALRAFRHLQSRPAPDGGWYQNWFLNGTPHWTSTELDQVALRSFSRGGSVSQTASTTIHTR